MTDTTATGRRLPREARREQLLDIGIELASATSLDQVSIDDVALTAGISRSLLFHYFPTKRDFQLALAARAADELRATVLPDPSLPAIAQLEAGVRAYVGYIDERRDAYLSLVRGAAGGDAAMVELFERTRQAIADHVVTAIGFSPASVPAAFGLAVRGWVAFAEEVTVVWIRRGGLDRDSLVDLLIRSMLGLFSQLPEAADEVQAALRGGDG